MLTPKEITKELYQRGYTDVTQGELVKNGVHLTVLTVRSSNSRISPCIYIDEMCRDLSNPADAADIIEEMLQNNPIPLNLDIDQIFSKEYILKNVYIALQRTSTQDLIRRDTEWKGIEEYCFVQNTLDERIWSFKLMPRHLPACHISIEELWAAAERNTYSEQEFRICSMGDILKEMTGSNPPQGSGLSSEMFVLTNPRKMHGAVQIFNRPALEKWAGETGFRKLIVIPSSLHEVILIPRDVSMTDLLPFNTMVQEANLKEVNEEEQLADQVYELEL